MRDWLPDPLARRPLVPLLLLAATLLLWHLGAYGLWESTEARYAEIAARMVRSGDWMTPRFNGIAHFDKPPLAYWASAASMALLGMDELGARLPLVLASLAVWRSSTGGVGYDVPPRRGVRVPGPSLVSDVVRALPEPDDRPLPDPVDRDRGRGRPTGHACPGVRAPGASRRGRRWAWDF